MTRAALLAGALAVLAAGCEGTAPGRRAPGFTLPDLAGTPVALDRHRGRVVLLCLWAGWAPPCRLQLIDLVRLQTRRGGERFGVLAVSVDQDAAQVARDVQGILINFPVLVGDDRVTAAYFRRGDLTVPLLLVLDRRGVIRARMLGYHSEAEVTAAVDRVLGS